MIKSSTFININISFGKEKPSNAIEKKMQLSLKNTFWGIKMFYLILSQTSLLCSFRSAPCTPTNLNLGLNNSSSVHVSWTANNRNATYTVSTDGGSGGYTCTTSGNSCDVTDLPCGSTYEFSVTASSSAGQSLPSFSISLETGERSKAG